MIFKIPSKKQASCFHTRKSKSIYILLSLCVIGFHSFAQEFSTTFGEISKAEFALDSFENEAYDAIILHDLGHSTAIENKQYTVKYTRHKRLKINTNRGRDLANFEILLFKDGKEKETFSDFKAHEVYIENDQFVFNEFDYEITKREELDANWSLIEISFPNINAGSIVEFIYSVYSPFINIPDWEFQDSIPTLFSQYHVCINKEYDFIYLTQGISGWEVNRVTRGNDSIVYTLGMVNIPPFIDNNYITSRNDYLAKIYFQLENIHYDDGYSESFKTSWQEINDYFLGRPQLGKFTSDARKTAKQLIKSGLFEKAVTELEKIKLAVHYVKENYNWNGYYQQIPEQKYSEFQTNKIGLAIELNLLLLGILNELEIEAKPVLISTRDYGKINSLYPAQHYFNSIIILSVVDNKILLLDATEKQIPYNRIPISCINEKGMVLSPDGPIWIDIKQPFASIYRSKFVGHLNESRDSIIYNCNIKASENQALQMREKYWGNPDIIYTNFKKENLVVNRKSIRVEGQDNVEDDYQLSFQAANALIEKEGKLLISPFIHEIFKTNPFTQKVRSYPIDMIYPRSRILSFEMQIPEDMQASNIPENEVINNELFQMSYVTALEGNMLKIGGLYAFKKEKYASDQYVELKSFMDLIIKKFNTQIIIEPIE